MARMLIYVRPLATPLSDGCGRTHAVVKAGHASSRRANARGHLNAALHLNACSPTRCMLSTEAASGAHRASPLAHLATAWRCPTDATRCLAVGHAGRRVVEDYERKSERLQRREWVLEVDIELVVVHLAHEHLRIALVAILARELNVLA